MTSPLAIQLQRTVVNEMHRCWRRLWPPHRRADDEYMRLRTAADRALLEALPRGASPAVSGTILVDSMWHNPNWWVRYGLLRSALGLESQREIAVLGEYNQKASQPIRDLMGLENRALDDFRRPKVEFDRLARDLLTNVREAEDLLRLDLPNGFPATTLYDWLLKRQRYATVDVCHSELCHDLSRALQTIDAGERMVDSLHPSLVVVSHSISVDYTALSWAAIRRNIPVVIGHGEYGLLRYWRAQAPEDLSLKSAMPKMEEVALLSSSQRESMLDTGLRYISQRLKGAARDLGAVYAFQGHGGMSRADIHQHFGWSDDRPLIAVYSMSWFDFPHIYGDLWFRDPLDWVESTVQQVIGSDHVHWLLRPHPCDAWYNTLNLRDILPANLPAHVGLAPLGWDGGAVARAIDGLVTMYGTAGVELAAAGKPVLVGSPGWYDDLGFVRRPASREEYLKLLRTDWWELLDLARTSERANIFACWHFCAPDWQDGFVLPDDSEQDAIYQQLPELLARNVDAIHREIATIRDWWNDDTPGYHSFKMRMADGYALSNVGG